MMKTIISVLICIHIFQSDHFAIAQTRPALEGVWKNTKYDSVVISKLGSTGIFYCLQLHGKYFGFKLNAKKDSLIHRTHGKIDYGFHIDNTQKFLIDDRQISSDRKSAYFTKFSAGNKTIRHRKLDAEEFFDLSTTQVDAGRNYDLSPKAALPFRINRLFIVKHRLDSMVVEKYEGKLNSEFDYTRKVLNQIFYFDVFGNVSAMRAVLPKESNLKGAFWKYTYTNANLGHLKTIIFPNRTVFFDEENLELDSSQMPVVRLPCMDLRWSYANGSDLPVKALINNYSPGSYLEIQYNKQRQLSRISLVDASFPEIKAFHTDFFYSPNGNLTKVVDIKEYKNTTRKKSHVKHP